MQLFEKDTESIMTQRMKLTEHQLLVQDGVPSLHLLQRFEIYMHKIRYNIKLTKDLSILDVMKSLFKFIQKQKVERPIEMIGLRDSTHDYNQTVHLTLDYLNLNSFWSSTGSDSKDASEWLLYQIKQSP